jgi:hypothetical protein
MVSDRDPNVYNITAQASGQTVPVVQTGGSIITPIADIVVTNVATLLRAANSSRLALGGTNNDPAVGIRLGDSTVTATKGQRVSAGASFKTNVTAAVFGISEGANVTVSQTEELR